MAKMVGVGRMLALLQLLAATSVTAHSWVEQMQVIDSNGSYVGDYGYPRGYVARTDPGFNNSFAVQWLLPPTDGSEVIRVTDEMNVCHPFQRTANYTTEYPQLKVSPGDWVAMKYLENGHVTQPWTQAGKPYGGGTVFLYGTTQSYADTKMVDVLRWNAQGTGGNKRGWLMSAQQFDDERCHQIGDSPISMFRQLAHPDRVAGQPNSTVEQWCESNLQIPEKVDGSSLTVYWVWQWNTAAGTVGAASGKDEYYTTCMDFDVVSGTAMNKQIVAAAKANTLQQQDPQTTAVADFRSRSAETMSPSWTTWNPSATIAAANVAAAEAATPATYYRIPQETFVTNGNTYVLQSQGTALDVNGQLTAYVDCTGAATTGTSAPVCSSSTAIAALPSTPAAAPATSTSSAAQAPAPDTNAGGEQQDTANGSQCGTKSVTVTATVTVTASTQQSALQDPATVPTSDTQVKSSSSSEYSGSVAFPTITVPAPLASAADSHESAVAPVVASMNGVAHEHVARRVVRHARNFRP